MKKAKGFGLPELMEKCQERLLASVQIHNCIRYYTTAEEIGAHVLKDHCSQIISTHWVSAGSLEKLYSDEKGFLTLCEKTQVENSGFWQN